MSMFIVFRTLRPDDPFFSRLIWFCSNETVVHVELVFRRHCPGYQTCRYRTLAANGGDETLHRGGCHWVSYTSHYYEGYNGPVGILNQTYLLKDGWMAMELRVHPHAARMCEQFLASQLHTSYDILGAVLNFSLLRPFIPDISVLEGMLKDDKDEKEWQDTNSIRLLETRKACVLKKRSWFCSALITMALAFAGILRPEELSARKSSPMDVFTVLQQRKIMHTVEVQLGIVPVHNSNADPTFPSISHTIPSAMATFVTTVTPTTDPTPTLDAAPKKAKRASSKPKTKTPKKKDGKQKPPRSVKKPKKPKSATAKKPKAAGSGKPKKPKVLSKNKVAKAITGAVKKELSKILK